tara:strand:- start:1134 stop:1523 length:390 start_codon:yes stop_codon:yes gene_type:complete
VARTLVTLNTSPAFTLVTLPFPSSSDGTCDTTSGDATVTMDSTSAISAEMNISGTGIPANTRVLSITNSTTFEMTKNATASNTNTTLTFTGALWSGVSLPTTTNWVLANSWEGKLKNWEDLTSTWEDFI